MDPIIVIISLSQAFARRIAMSFFALFLLIPTFALGAPIPVELFDHTLSLVKKNFYDQTFRGLPWDTLVTEKREKISTHTTDQKLSETINGLLSLLQASHTAFLTSEDQEYYALKSVFANQLDGFPYCTIGAWFERKDGAWFVRSVFSESPADKAGILSGDEVISINDQPIEPVQSFDCETRKSYKIKVKHTRGGQSFEFTISPQIFAPQRALLNSTISSRRVFNFSGKRIGYFHLWSGTHDSFKEELASAAKFFEENSDSLILDLRDGLGGAHPGYLNPFFNHDEEGNPIPKQYTKPLIVLINEGVRSGKEWIASLLKTSHRGILVGSRTRGYFLAGKLFDILPSRFALYLAVAEFKPGGIDLEGKGVSPDIEVPFDFRYANGADPQLQGAIKEAIAGLRN